MAILIAVAADHRTGVDRMTALKGQVVNIPLGLSVPLAAFLGTARRVLRNERRSN